MHRTLKFRIYPNREQGEPLLARSVRVIRRTSRHPSSLQLLNDDRAVALGVVVTDLVQEPCLLAGLNRSILDAGWSQLATMLRYKLEERGGQLVEVPAAYSSQTCSVCGVVDAASRRTQSEFYCVSCGHSENADVNAARVILSRWSPPVQPVEGKPKRVPLKQEAPGGAGYESVTVDFGEVVK